MTDSENNTVILYSQPGCGPCVGVKRHLDANDIPYVIKNIREDEDAAARVISLGYSGTPVVEHPGGHFGGFDTEKLAKMQAALF